MSQLNILLFDVDGVLIDAKAYRICVARTLSVLLPQIGLKEPASFLPTDSDIAYFEAKGIHDVWDITNIIYAQLLCATQDSPATAVVPNYKAFVDRMGGTGSMAQPGKAASTLLCRDLEATGDNATTRELTNQIQQFLPGARSAYESHVTRLFQNILLGTAAFRAAYGLTSECNSQPLLRAEDRVLISDGSIEKLRTLQALGQTKASVYTARPSHPPSFATGSQRGFSPEAEMALEMTGLTEFPLVAMGTMEWLAAQKHRLPEDLVKPNFTQAFAALLCALNGSVSPELLDQSYALATNSLPISQSLFVRVKPQHLRISIFEDTVSGLLPMRVITEQLNKAGFDIQLNCLGIATDEAKRNALSKLCANVFSDVNEAIDFIMPQSSAPVLEKIGDER